MNATDGMFHDQDIELLYAPHRWRVVSSACGNEAPPAQDPSHRRWRLKHVHAHPHCELLLALSGDVPYGHAIGNVRCAPGALLYFESMEAHDDGYPASTGNARHLWFGIGGNAAIARVVEQRDGRMIQPAPPLALGAAELGFDPTVAMARIPALARHEPRLARLELLAVTQAMVVRAIEANRVFAAGDSSPARAVEVVRRHIHETAGAGVSLDGLARLSGYSKFHLVRLFRAHAGMGLREWTDRCRFERLQRLQRAGSSLAEAAQVLGFSSASALSRWCSRHGLRWRQRQRDSAT